MRIVYMMIGGAIVIAIEGAFIAGAVLTADISARANAKRHIDEEEA